MNSIFKSWMSYVFITLITFMIISIWLNKKVDWALFGLLCIGSFIGTIIGQALKKSFKND